MDDAFVRAVCPVPLPNKCHLHCREMRRICLRRRKGGLQWVSFFNTTWITNIDVQLRSLRDQAWSVSQEAHHRLTTNTQLPVWLLLRQSWGVKLFFFSVFIVSSCSNFQKCTTLFVRWPKCKCPKSWYCCLSQCFFFCMYMRVKTCNGFYLDLGDAQMDLIYG